MIIRSFIWMSLLSFVFFSFSNAVHAKELSGEFCKSIERRKLKEVRARVVRVVDGDTAVVNVGREQVKVRLLSIDTPETNYQGKSQDNQKTRRAWAKEATQRLASILKKGDLIRLEFDEQPCDYYGRALGLVFKSSVFVNRLLVEEARAVNYCIYPNIKYCDEFVSIVDSLVKKRRGIYGDPALDLPYIWRRKVGNRKYTKYIGSLVTHQVFRPGSFRRVPVSERVFFMKRSDIKPPFRLVD